MIYTSEMAIFVQNLRDNGYTWSQVEEEFEKEFGEYKTHEAIRKGIQRVLVQSLEDVDDVDVGEAQPYRPGEPLPEYLLYRPKSYRQQVGKSYGTALFITDSHHPYSDQRAYQLMIKVAKDVQPQEIIIGGDFADFYAINSHGKHPDFQHILLQEITEVRKRLEELRVLFPKAKIVFIEGNHEYRLARYIYNNAKELHGLLDTRSVLCLDQLGIDLIPYDADQRYQVMGSKLYTRHEPIGGGIHFAASTVDKAGCSMVVFHTHRAQSHRKVFLDGTDHIVACFGWLGDKSHPVMKYLKNHAQWQLGFGFAHILKDGKFFLDAKDMIDYTVFHNGKVYKG
jgi:predicted MPP superfamily phosphohydrolase